MTKSRRREGNDPRVALTQKEPEGEKPREIYVVRSAGETFGAVRGAAVDDPGSGFVTVQGGAADVKELLEKVEAGDRWVAFDEYRPFRARDWFPRWRRGLVI